MTITVLPTMPTPPNSVTRPGTFNTDADATFAKLPEVIEKYNANVPLLNDVVDAAGVTRAAVQASAEQAEVARDDAQEAALTALNAPGVMATSSTSLDLTAGIKDLVLDQVGKIFGKGQTVVLALTANPLIQALAIVLDNVPGTGALRLSVSLPTGGGTHTGWTISVGAPTAPLPRLSYADRGQLRTLAAVAGAGATVEGLGLFVYTPGSTEPDDDESCFATVSGRWLLEAPSFGVVYAWLTPLLEGLVPAQILHGSGVCSITSVAASSQVSFAIGVDGAEVGDRVVLAPPGAMAYHATYFGRVTATGLVTVYLSNVRNDVGPLATGFSGLWAVTVIKEF